MSKKIRMAMLGCGGMSGAHGNGLKELWEKDIKLFDIVATCDIVEANAKARAEQIAAFQGKMPKIYTSVDDMLKNERDLDAVDICSVHRLHHILAVPCLEAGVNVIIEKPLGITMRACNLIVDSAKKNSKILSVAENYRLSPGHRAVNWAIRQGYIGKPRSSFGRMLVRLSGRWGWRDYKAQAGAGWLLDGGVHFADLFRYHLGCEATEVSATVRSYMPFRYKKPDTMEDPIDVTVEDTTIATIKFENDIIVQWVICRAAPGHGIGGHVIHGSEGSIDLGGNVTQRKESIEGAKINEMFMASLSEEERENFFPRGITDTVAIELKYFAEAIQTGGKPEVDGVEGLKDEAICMACLESSWFNMPVEMSKIENCEIEGYQKELNDDLGI